MIRRVLLFTARTFTIGLALALGACAHDAQPAISTPLRGSPTEDVTSTYSEALTCIARYTAAQSYPAPRVAIGHISDMTGAQDSFLGRRFTQGATLMAMTAASRAGFRLVERFDIGVVQVDLDYARRGMVRDAPGVVRTPAAGQIQGADLYIVGGITEFNPNIRSSGGSAFVGPKLGGDGALSVRRNTAVFDLAIDLRLIDARSTDVLAVRSLRKQIRAIELEGGVLGLAHPVTDVTAGSRALEPAQTAIREMIDRAVYEFATKLYALDPHACLEEGTARPAVVNSSPKAAQGALLPPDARSAELVLDHDIGSLDIARPLATPPEQITPVRTSTGNRNAKRLLPSASDAPKPADCHLQQRLPLRGRSV